VASELMILFVQRMAGYSVDPGVEETVRLWRGPSPL